MANNLTLNDIKIAVEDFKKANDLMLSVLETLDADDFGYSTMDPLVIRFYMINELQKVAKTLKKTIRLRLVKGEKFDTYEASITYRGVIFRSTAWNQIEVDEMLSEGAVMESEEKGENA